MEDSLQGSARLSDILRASNPASTPNETKKMVKEPQNVEEKNDGMNTLQLPRRLKRRAEKGNRGGIASGTNKCPFLYINVRILFAR